MTTEPQQPAARSRENTRARLLDAAAEATRAVPTRDVDVGDISATMVRPVLPKFALRGLSGELFGRSFPLLASLNVGRADDAGLRIPLDSISRLHARLTPAGDERAGQGVRAVVVKAGGNP